jgi:predicted membrane channel-forming protein YqfA (hemolysin III family)
MGIGSGIFVFVVGAILAFAVTVQIAWIDLRLVGYILMGAGVVIFVLSLIFTLRRRGSTVTTRNGVDPSTGERIEERRTRSDEL